MSVLATILQLALMCAAPEAPSSDPVRAAAREAAILVRQGRHEEAMQTLDAAQTAAGVATPVFVYMRGVIEEERGNCEMAIRHYDRFLEFDIPEVDASAARRRREACAEQIPAADPVPAPVAVAPPPIQAPAETSVSEQPHPKPWYTDPAGASLTAVGAAGLVAGVSVYLVARSDERAARSATALERFDAAGTRAERLSRAGVVTLSIAGAVLISGIVRYAIVGSRRTRKRDLAYKHYFGTLSRLR